MTQQLLGHAEESYGESIGPLAAPTLCPQTPTVPALDGIAEQVLDKGHRSFKQLMSRKIAGYDIIVSAQKPEHPRAGKAPRRATAEEITRQANALRLPGALDLQALQQLYARVVASFLREGLLAAVSIRDIAPLVHGSVRPSMPGPEYSGIRESMRATGKGATIRGRSP
ncbi:MAG: hypothetical protein ACRDJF_01810 [Actinomycetota bacterium]